MSVLITGGNGYLASNIIKSFNKQNYKLKIFTSKKNINYNNSKNIEYFTYDNSDIYNFQKCLIDVDTIFHTASLDSKKCNLSMEEAIRINEKLTSKLVLEAISMNVKNFIFFSTAHVYSDNLQGSISEETFPNNKNNNYAITKLAAENKIKELCVDTNLNYLILRISNVFGMPIIENTQCNNLLVHDLCQQCFTNKSIKLNSKINSFRDFITINDFVNFINYLYSNIELSKKYEVLNIGSGITTSILDIAKLIKKNYHSKFNREITINYKFEKNFTNHFEFNIQKLKETGFVLKNDYNETIEQILKIYNQN